MSINIMKAIAFVCLVLAAVNVSAHSWVACSDYRGSPDYYDDSKCFAYPRRWASARSEALAPMTNGYQIGIDTGYNYQPTASDACQFPMSSPVDSAYTTSYPKAIYEQGQLYCLAWPTKNHVAATCTNQYIPEGQMKLKVSAINPTRDPAQSGFTDVATAFGSHTNGNIDCIGFQRSPKFCENTDKALSTGCFKVPSGMAAGRYVFQWYWEFNPGEFYSTCYDAQVVAAGTGRGAGGLTASDGRDTLGKGGSTCKNNWATVNNNAGVTSTTPGPAISTGTSTTPSTPSSTGTVPAGGDTVRITSVPASIRGAVQATSNVAIEWTVSGSRVITIDLLDASSNWYGKGMVSIPASGKGSASVTITNEEAIPSGTKITVGAWIVTQQVYNDWQAQMQLPEGSRDPVKSQPWTQELDRAQAFTTVSGTPTVSSSTGTRASSSTGRASSTASSTGTSTTRSSTGTSTTPSTPSSTGTVPAGGDTVRLTALPGSIRGAAQATFTVGIEWSVSGSRVVTIDILDASGTYGKGIVAISGNGQGSGTVTITIDQAIPSGKKVTLRAWMVTQQVYSDWEAQLLLPVGSRDPVKSQPWTQELDRDEATAVVGATSTVTSSTGIDSISAALPSSRWSLLVMIAATMVAAVGRHML